MKRMYLTKQIYVCESMVWYRIASLMVECASGERLGEWANERVHRNVNVKWRKEDEIEMKERETSMTGLERTRSSMYNKSYIT